MGVENQKKKKMLENSGEKSNKEKPQSEKH
jgi:hypothetical protein